MPVDAAQAWYVSTSSWSEGVEIFRLVDASNVLWYRTHTIPLDVRVVGHSRAREYRSPSVTAALAAAGTYVDTAAGMAATAAAGTSAANVVAVAGAAVLSFARRVPLRRQKTPELASTATTVRPQKQRDDLHVHEQRMTTLGRALRWSHPTKFLHKVDVDYVVRVQLRLCVAGWALLSYDEVHYLY